MALKFGTSGVRGLVSEMSDYECWLFARAFVRHARSRGTVEAVGLSGDLRSSTGRILVAVSLALEDEGVRVIHCGRIPTPALCLFGLSRRIPTIMVTGSHIPDDRNGIKFNLPAGEILKEDEKGILQGYQALRNSSQLPFQPFLRDESISVPRPDLPGPVDPTAEQEYLRRYLEFFPERALGGLHVGVYQHSTVGRDILCRVLEDLGAKVEPLARSDTFIAVDTEAVDNPEQLAAWVHERSLDALVSMDGDADRPLLVTDRGKVVHGDLLGTLVSSYLSADAVVLPVSCNTAVERWARFPNVRRTRIGSPFVIRGMLDAIEEGHRRVVGFEANGGFLLGTDWPESERSRSLAALPTRDALLPLLCALHMARTEGCPLSELRRRLPERYTWSERLRRFPSETGAAIIDLLRRRTGPSATDLFRDSLGDVQQMDFTDGARLTFESGEIVHFRPSGNAPEFRCYTEADTEERARSINALAMDILLGRLRPRIES